MGDHEFIGVQNISLTPMFGDGVSEHKALMPPCYPTNVFLLSAPLSSGQILEGNVPAGLHVCAVISKGICQISNVELDSFRAFCK